MVNIDDFRPLCKSWLDARTIKEANAIADKIDHEIVSSSHVRWAKLHRAIDDLPLKFKHVSYGILLDRDQHPKHKQPGKSSKKKEEEEINA